jgi:CDP-4-dehydro-6-deoxyglucose reductase
MSNLLSVTRAARLVGVPRAELQKRVQSGELVSFDGMLSVENLLACYPQAELEDTAELQRIAQIKEKAFGKRVFERALPEPEVLAARVTELSRNLAVSQKQVRQFNELLSRLWDKLEALRATETAPGVALASVTQWIKQEVALAMEPGFNNPLAIKDGILRVMAAQVSLRPSGQDFLVEGQDTLLEAAMRAGLSLSYGCSGGNCGLCKAKVVSGEVKKTRHHDFKISEQDEAAGYMLMCCNTAVGDLTLEAEVAGSVQDIPFQQVGTRVKLVQPLSAKVMLLHLQTPRSQRLRFLAGQSAGLRVGQAFTALLPIASCPCDDRNLLFHVHQQGGNLFADYVFERLKSGDSVEIEGPQGEFILHEKSERPLYFIAFDGGFAPIKSLIEHAMSLEAEAIHLIRVGSDVDEIYLANQARAWADALDNFSYAEEIAGFDLRSLNPHREHILENLLTEITRQYPAISAADVYLAGPEAAVQYTEHFFLALGMPKSRVFVEVVK